MYDFGMVMVTKLDGGGLRIAFRCGCRAYAIRKGYIIAPCKTHGEKGE